MNILLTQYLQTLRYNYTELNRLAYIYGGSKKYLLLQVCAARNNNTRLSLSVARAIVKHSNGKLTLEQALSGGCDE
jgi:hypothetical protein